MISTGNGPEKSAHGVERRGRRRVEQLGDDLADHRFERGDGPRGEHPADQGPEPVVLGRVHHDDMSSARIRFGSLVRRGQIDTVGAGEAPPVTMGRHHVLESGEGIEPVPLVEVDGRLVAQPPVHLGGVLEVLVGERVELDCGRGHGASEAGQKR